jgi:hypothetical protein
MQTQEAEDSVLRSFVITQGPRQRFITRSESDRYWTAGRLRVCLPLRETNKLDSREKQETSWNDLTNKTNWQHTNPSFLPQAMSRL